MRGGAGFVGRLDSSVKIISPPEGGVGGL